MRKIARHWQAFLSLLILIGCAPQTGPAPRPATGEAPSVAPAPAAHPDAPIVSSFVQDVLREAAPDPIAALPVQVHPLRLAGTWSGEALRRLGNLTLRSMAESVNGTESKDALANSYRFVWWAPPVMALSDARADLRRWLVDPGDPSALARKCETARQTDEYFDRISCDQNAEKTLAQAELQLAVGDQPAAEALYGQAIAAMPIASGATKCNHDITDFPQAVDSGCVGFLEQRAAYEGLTGHVDEYLVTMKTALTLPPRTRKWDRAELPPQDLGRWTYILMRASGRLQAFGRLADMMTTEKLLSLWDVTDDLFEEIDRQAAAPGGLANAANLLAVASRLSTREIGMAAGNQEPLRLALDCRAGEVRALGPGGSQEVAALLPEMVDRYVRTDGEYFATSLCLYELADRLKRDDERARVLAHVQNMREQSIAKSQENARNFSGEHKDAAEHGAELERIIAKPWLPFLADEAALREAIVAALNRSKAAPMKSLDYESLMNIVLWVSMYRSG